MRWLLLCLLTGCWGDVVGPDEAPLCVEAAFETGPRARVMAVMHFEDGAPEILADVPLADGRGCLTLRPPPAAALPSLGGGPTAFDSTPHAIEVINPVLEAQGFDRSFDYGGVLIDLAVYEDGDGSGAFEPADAAGEGSDSLLTRLSASDAARLPFWFFHGDAQLERSPPGLLELVYESLAPGNVPFAVTRPTNAPRAWRKADTPRLAPWPDRLTLPPTAAGTWCNIGSAWPRCRSVEDDAAFVDARLVDPRVPAARLAKPATGFDPAIALPPDDAPVSTEVIARRCADVDGLRVARERTFVPRQAEDSCLCTVWVRTRWVIAPADDPPEWLVCGGRALSEADGRALAEDAGLILP